MIIKDALISPYFIERNYNGYYLHDESSNKPDEKIMQTTKIEEMLTDIVNRKIAADKTVTTLKGYVVMQGKMYAELQKVMEVKENDVTAETIETVETETVSESVN